MKNSPRIVSWSKKWDIAILPIRIYLFAWCSATEYIRYSAYIENLKNTDKTPLERFLEGKDLLTNDLEMPSLEMIPEIGKAMEVLSETGAEFSRMTGSGSAVFAMYDSEDARDAAYKTIKEAPELSGCDVFVSKTI